MTGGGGKNLNLANFWRKKGELDFKVQESKSKDDQSSNSKKCANCSKKLMMYSTSYLSACL